VEEAETLLAHKLHRFRGKETKYVSDSKLSIFHGFPGYSSWIPPP